MREPLRRSEPIPLADFVTRAFQRHGWSSAAAEREVVEAWNSILPPEWRAHCRPLRFRGGRLTVAVDSAPLMEELRSFHAASLLRLLQEALRLRASRLSVQVRRLDFRVA